MAAIKGLDKLLKKLKEIDKDFPEHAEGIIKGNAIEIAGNAQLLAPHEYGDLIRSIRSKKVEDLTYAVTVGVSYGAYQEFGTGGFVSVPPELPEQAIKFKGKGKGLIFKQQSGPGRTINMRPQPYLWPAFGIQRPVVIKSFERLINKLLNK